MLTNLSNLNTVAFYVTLGAIFAFLLLLILFLRSGHGYSVHDTEAHSTNFAGQIREGHGGLTAFLWFIYAVMFVWTIIYIVQNWSDFAILFA
jgi:hypothetical protein